MKWWTSPYRYINMRIEDTLSHVDLATAYPINDRIGFTLTVAGKPQKFEMTRSAAAHFAGRIAEALAK